MGRWKDKSAGVKVSYKNHSVLKHEERKRKRNSQLVEEAPKKRKKDVTEGKVQQSEDKNERQSHKIKTQKKQKKETVIDDLEVKESKSNDDCDASRSSKTKKNKKNTVADDNPKFDQDSQINKEIQIPEEPIFDVMLNVTNTPVAPKAPKLEKRRKNGRYSYINEERIFPNQSQQDRNYSRAVDLTEVKSGINETEFIGEVGNPDGDNEQLPEGTKLKFRFANFEKRSCSWRKPTTSAKSSYKHRIKGDIILGFKNTNLHKIMGYGVNK